MQIAMGCDHAGVEIKKEIVQLLQNEGHVVIDCGTDTSESVDYPDIAEKVAAQVMDKQIKGIIICGTGIGISIAANKVSGIRAALCNDVYTASLARQHNDANIVAVGARVTGPGLIQAIIQTFLETKFEGGRHQRRVDKIMALEKQGKTDDGI
ncbi:MAG: ribose 5-phosphate isomerase B [Bacillota bacterium]|nr:ribose 5-phosphate isomerase B [Bacillota bacterium]